MTSSQEAQGSGLTAQGSQLIPHSSTVVTASTQVQDTYYGSPVIKAPHWKWLIINYFFCGALAGGGFTIATLAELFSKDRGLVRAGRYLSFAALVPSMPLLILDLGRPERFLNMLRIVKLRSPMSLGSWALTGLGLFSGLAAGLQLLADMTHRDLLPGPRRLIGVLGLPFSVFVAGYTGLLLAITNVPLWAKNYLLMGPTFMASAFSSTFAALSIILGFGEGDRERSAKGVARAEVICLSAELGLLTVGIIRLGGLGKPLTTGKWGMLFWPLTYVNGIVLPLILQLTGPARGNNRTRAQRTATALQVLAGGYVLRMLMIFAGRESANRPADYFEYTSRER